MLASTLFSDGGNSMDNDITTIPGRDVRCVTAGRLCHDWVIVIFVACTGCAADSFRLRHTKDHYGNLASRRQPNMR